MIPRPLAAGSLHCCLCQNRKNGILPGNPSIPPETLMGIPLEKLMKTPLQILQGLYLFHILAS
jgi:hypothetical protein